jgi:hypothetical protein
MTALLMLQAPSPEAVGRLVALLERYRHTSPLLAEELTRQQTLTHTLAEHRIHGERTLSAWRTALSRRWACEVDAQRALRKVQRQLTDLLGADDAHAALFGSAPGDAQSTPTNLLAELRRLEAAIDLLTPRPPFAESARTRLRLASDELASAIEESQRCENERRSVLSEQRVAMSLYERAYERARRLLSSEIGDQALALPPVFPCDGDGA